MKRIAVLLSFIMMASVLSSCGEKKEEVNKETAEVTESETETKAETETETETEPPEPEYAPLFQELTGDNIKRILITNDTDKTITGFALTDPLNGEIISGEEPATFLAGETRALYTDMSSVSDDKDIDVNVSTEEGGSYILHDFPYDDAVMINVKYGVGDILYIIYTDDEGEETDTLQDELEIKEEEEAARLAAEQQYSQPQTNQQTYEQPAQNNSSPDDGCLNGADLY